jgi:transposase-like protein
MKQAKQVKQLRQRRLFSDELKRKIVSDVERNKVSVSAVCREYSVSAVSVYKWLNKYSRHLQSGKTLVVQMESEQYRSKELEKKVAELEAAIGRKQLEIDFLNKLIEVAGEELKVDLKKSFCTPLCGGSKTTGGSMLTK